MFDEEKVKRLSEWYGFSYRHFSDTILITTDLDEWRLDITETYDKFANMRMDKVLVQHLSTSGNRTQKMKFHTQRIVRNLEQAFDLINKHEHYKATKEIGFNVDRSWRLQTV